MSLVSAPGPVVPGGGRFSAKLLARRVLPCWVSMYSAAVGPEVVRAGGDGGAAISIGRVGSLGAGSGGVGAGSGGVGGGSAGGATAVAADLGRGGGAGTGV